MVTIQLSHCNVKVTQYGNKPYGSVPIKIFIHGYWNLNFIQLNSFIQTLEARIWWSDCSWRIPDSFSKHSRQWPEEISPVDSNMTGIFVTMFSLLSICPLLPLSHTTLHVCDCVSVSRTGLWALYGQGLCFTCSFICSTSHSTWNVTGTWYISPELNHIPWHHIPWFCCQSVTWEAIQE